MIKLVEILKDIFCEKMASKPPEFTGLPFKVYVSRNENFRHNRPRLKLFSAEYKWSISIDDPIEVIEGEFNKIDSKQWKTIVKWITENRTGLMGVWNGSIHPKDFLDHNKKV